ncbi:MAG TPA: type II secretion system F family protein [Stellaceae bacterium]|nr:type II secretion system F family protein [Stellaceae bacterium]
MTPMTITVVAVMLLAITSALGYVIAQNTGSRARMKMRLAAIGGGVKPGAAAKKGQSNLRRSRQLKTKLDEAAETGKPSRGVELRLMIERAGLTISTRTYYIISAVSGVVFTGLFLLMGFSWIWTPFVLIAMGVGLPRRWLKRRAGKRQYHFTQHFADAIDVIVRGIRSGLPVGECLNIVARESPEPVGTEFKLLVEGQRLGMTLKQALERSVRHMPTADMKFFAIVINLQQQTGGNLAETLAGLSDVLRQRKRMADKVRAMSSEARMTATIIGSMPFIISILIYVINPDYISLLWTTSAGKKIFYGGLAWMSLGVFIMKQMISFEI